MAGLLVTTGLGWLMLGGCGDPPQVRGVVQDVWGKPIDGATVSMEGVVEKVSTDAGGAFSFALGKEASMRFMAGKDGYIRDTLKVEGAAEGGDVKVTLNLYPEPKESGFYAVDRKDYKVVGPEPVRTVGTELRAVTGLSEPGEAGLTGGPKLRFVFSSELRSSDLARLELKLHRLSFTPSASMPSVLGETDVTVNLWVVDQAVNFDLVELQSKDDYLITPREKLTKGVYAFSTKGVLNSEEIGALDKLPEELRVAYPFEVL